jgi:hypothetical protein
VWENKPKRIVQNLLTAHVRLTGRLSRWFRTQANQVEIHGVKATRVLLADGYTLVRAEFQSCSRQLMELGNRPAATFVGEETGGGYYGNTSGFEIRLTLPNSTLWIRIPLLKFVVEVGGDIPFGRGVMPDHEIQPTIDEYLNGVDAEINYNLKVIRDTK